MPNLLQDIVTHKILNKQRNLTVSNTAAETNLWSYNVPGNTLKTNNAIHVRIIGSCFCNTGGSDEGLAMKWLYGATTLFNDTGISIITHATRRKPFDFDVVLAADNATNAQIFSGRMFMASTDEAGYAVTTGHGDISSPEAQFLSAINGVSSSIDSTANQLLRVTVTMENADTNYSFVVRYAYVELISY